MVSGLPNGEPVWLRVTAVDAVGERVRPELAGLGSAERPDRRRTRRVTDTLSPVQDTTVRAGEFTVTVPAGTVEVAGTAVTVTPLPPVDGQLPAVDVHIHGDWDPAAGGVEVQLPRGRSPTFPTTGRW